MASKLTSTACLFLLSGCAHQPSTYSYDAPGFFMGLVHGYIALFSVVVGLFTDVRIYNFPNSGYWYDVGFIIGFLFFMFNVAVWLAEQ
jgi:hypothetical protein